MTTQQAENGKILFRSQFSFEGVWPEPLVLILYLVPSTPLVLIGP